MECSDHLLASIPSCCFFLLLKYTISTCLFTWSHVVGNDLFLIFLEGKMIKQDLIKALNSLFKRCMFRTQVRETHVWVQLTVLLTGRMETMNSLRLASSTFLIQHPYMHTSKWYMQLVDKSMNCPAPAPERLYVSSLPSAFESCYAHERTFKPKLSVILPHSDNSQSVSQCFTPAWLKQSLGEWSCDGELNPTRSKKEKWLVLRLQRLKALLNTKIRSWLFSKDSLYIAKKSI